MESDCTLRFGFNALTKSILYTKQWHLFLHLLSTLKHLLSVSLKQQTLVKEQQNLHINSLNLHQKNTADWFQNSDPNSATGANKLLQLTLQKHNQCSKSDSDLTKINNQKKEGSFSIVKHESLNTKCTVQ